MTSITRHAFLTPGHNCWLVWTADGSKSLTNEGSTHRVYETLVYAIDMMADEGWQVQNIFVEQGAPSLVLLSRAQTTDV